MKLGTHVYFKLSEIPQGPLLVPLTKICKAKKDPILERELGECGIAKSNISDGFEAWAASGLQGVILIVDVKDL